MVDMKDIEGQVRGRLERDLGRVTHWVAALRAGWRPEELEAGGDNTPLSEAADAAQVVEERETGTQLLDRLVHRGEEIRGALRRLDEGTYGFCVSCSRTIHPKRLMARPEASLCLDCQTERERHHPDRVTREPVLDASPLD
ncbi:MAG TPA: TraR/DksA family transcriptional regulator [Candidatus Polarisedimenticolia bacterium]|nr:TraR/DksA family transcriptional regulator [Candidatus Polarisedimenticolia bacterium]